MRGRWALRGACLLLLVVLMQSVAGCQASQPEHRSQPEHGAECTMAPAVCSAGKRAGTAIPSERSKSLAVAAAGAVASVWVAVSNRGCDAPA